MPPKELLRFMGLNARVEQTEMGSSLAFQILPKHALAWSPTVLADNLRSTVRILRRPHDPVKIPLCFFADETYLWRKFDCVRSDDNNIVIMGGRWAEDAGNDRSDAPI